MFTKIKVAFLRWYYRFLTVRAWPDCRDKHSNNSVSTLQATVPDGQLALRMYTNNQGADKPLIVYFHGGGWVIGDLDTHHPFCQELCSRSGCTVVSVNYRLAPEHRFPAAHDDCLAATTWVAGKLGELGPNNGTLILAGDSAGGNLATCTALELGIEQRSRLAGEIVIYPVADHYSIPYPSYQERGKGYVLSSKMMYWFWDTYLGKSAQNIPQRATPIQATNLASLPPTLLITAENDPLRDEGIAYGEKLREANVPVQHHHFEQDEHGFACSSGATESFGKLMTSVCAWIDKLGEAPASRNAADS